MHTKVFLQVDSITAIQQVCNGPVRHLVPVPSVWHVVMMEVAVEKM